MEHQRQASVIKGEVVIIRYGHSVPGKSVSVHVCSCTEDNPGSGRGRLSESAYLKQGKSNTINGIKTTTYKVKLHVDPEFGIPGALVIKSQNKQKFFIQSASLQAFNQTIHFNCNSWMYPFKKTKADRVFFSNTSYLPNQTPSALMELRKNELESLRGERTGERKEWDRIYDYDCYNDLGNPDKGRKHTRPVLGGSVSHPYPRRLRTGRPPSNEDLFTESHSGKDNLDIYVPPDERFSPKKLSAFILNSFQATIHFLSPEEKSLFQQDFSSFHTFEETHRMFSSNRSHAVEE